MHIRRLLSSDLDQGCTHAMLALFAVDKELINKNKIKLQIIILNTNNNKKIAYSKSIFLFQYYYSHDM